MDSTVSKEQKTPNAHGSPELSTLDAPVSPPRRRPPTMSITTSCPGKNENLEPLALPRRQWARNYFTSLTCSAEDKVEQIVDEKDHRGISPSLAAIEAGQIEVADHLSIFADRLGKCARPVVPQEARISIEDWVKLYQRNEQPHGHHFVIHQHDHPVAGPHYDLRLQISESSSVSWSVMYGLPGNANSRKLNRNATETRVHCLWNHLVEAASASTGSMIIWDTGEYEVLPYQMPPELPETEDSRSDISARSADLKTESEKLRESFQNRKIRLRLHGNRLPRDYTIVLRLDKNIDFTKLGLLPRKRRRRKQSRRMAADQARLSTSSSSPSPSLSPSITPLTRQTVSGHAETSKGHSKGAQRGEDKLASASEDESEIDRQIRVNNAYPGATNSIGSIHQRRWFITLDRVNSGFELDSKTPGQKRWVRNWSVDEERLLGFEPFFVQGPDVERSVVTGRLGREVLSDDRVDGFIPRKGWRPVLY